MSLLDTASLIVTPNGYKEGKLYSVIPSSGAGDMSVTRATTATRVNSAGLVELVPYNLFQYSEDFTNSYWEKGEAIITANATIAPNGTNTADKLNETATTDTHQIYRTFSGSLGVATIFVYAKKAERSGLQVTSDQSTDPSAFFNLNTGTIHSSSNCTAFIESVGNGWFKCGITYTIDQTTTYPVFRVVDSSFNLIYTGTAGFGIFIWGAQLNEGTAKDYQRTETRLNIPRLDYSNGSCPSLLVEPQRTNLALWSEQFDNASWGVQSATITSNDTTAPDGNTTADRLSVTVNAYAGLYQAGNNAVNKFSTSIFAKKGTKDWLYFVNASASLAVAFFNLSNGTLGTIINGTATIEDFGNGWYRCTYSDTNDINNLGYQIGLSDANNSVTPSSSGSAYIWGAQREAGSYPTSYIPTTSASVTRNAEQVYKTGISSLIGQTEGTIFFDVVINGCQNALANLINTEKNTNTAFAIGYIKASKNIYGHVFDGSEKGRIQGGTFEIGQRLKIAYAYKSGNFALYVNGIALGTNANTFTFPSTLDDIFIGDSVTFFNWQESISNNVTALWKTRLTNTQLAELTTL